MCGLWSGTWCSGSGQFPIPFVPGLTGRARLDHRLESPARSRDLSRHDDPNLPLPSRRSSRARPLASRDAGMPGPDPFEQRGRRAHAPAGAASGHGASRARGGDPASVRQLARHPGTRLVALSWVPTNSGLVQDAGAVGEVCAELGVPYLIDACQAVGQLAVDVAALRCDFLAGTGRKFLRGPRGIGFLYVSDRMLERGAFPLFLDMRGADWTDPDAFRLADGARRFENWEFAYALVAGLGAATRYALAVGSGGRERAHRLAALLRQLLAEIPGVRVLDRGRERCALVSVGVAGRDAADLKLRLRARVIDPYSAH